MDQWGKDGLWAFVAVVAVVVPVLEPNVAACLLMAAMMAMHDSVPQPARSLRYVLGPVSQGKKEGSG